MTRTFIAIEMDTAQQQFLAQIIQHGKKLLPELNWVNPTSIHLTLAFPGELDDSQLKLVCTATEEAVRKSKPFSYRLSRLGIFGSQRSPRVLWMGIDEPTGSLDALNRQLTLSLAKQGFPPEERPFNPHITLARIKHPLTAENVSLLQHMIADEKGHTHRSQVKNISVMKSELLPSGALYTHLQDIVLKKGKSA